MSASQGRTSTPVSPTLIVTDDTDRQITHYSHPKQQLASRYEPDQGLSLSRLSRIWEANGLTTTTSSRPVTRGSDQRRHRERSSTRRTRIADEDSNYGNSLYRRSVKPHHRPALPRGLEASSRTNPSLLSLLSSLTRTSDRSSGSNTTVTQRSYDRKTYERSRISNNMTRPKSSRKETSNDKHSRADSADVFKYMIDTSIANEKEHHSSSLASPSSSQYSSSDAGSSEDLGTPSSRSTFPSPTDTRSQSVNDMRQKFNSEFASSVRCDSHSPDPSLRSRSKQASVSDVDENGNEEKHDDDDEDEDEDDDEDDDEDEDQDDEEEEEEDQDDDEEEERRDLVAPLEVIQQRQRSCSRSSRPLSRPDNLSHQQDARRQHISYATNVQHDQVAEPMHNEKRSASTSSTGSERAAYAYHMAIQQYQYPPPPGGPFPGPIMNTQMIHPDHPPHAPDSPDVSQRTMAGYEMIAHELSDRESQISTVYRKFEYLNHRVLLHLQDELSELEEQLRTVDELIIQMDPALKEGKTTPVSRRGEAYCGGEIHYRRTSLLGRIFIKTEQYNRAMSSYATMSKDFRPAQPEQIETYRAWMNAHAPLHEIETRFLQRGHDLIVPESSNRPGNRPITTPSNSAKNSTLVYLPIALMLPVILFSVIPSLTGRLMVTALIAAGAFVAASSTRIGTMLEPREWTVCGAAYVLVMSALAGCIPRHAA
ncbi:Hypothetical protein R9X50_00300700 [Acrodontium crateriforme]|uniref:DUF6594 domain-containing protein n=1 Tax=Acrodontium crateriforme TaxID=150365 RepID=A0AAQ3M221_9PEZI|nr:Hypothetical protein R9X50_00300700 [Acrodontium crateriforme]